MERRTLRRVGAVLLGLALLAAVLATRALRNDRNEGAAYAAQYGHKGQRIRVAVLNATTTRGLARRTTLHLRDRGFDVVEIGTSDMRLDSTLVIDRSGHPAWAREVADALGGARVESRPDSSRYLDVTVLLGRTWTPPPQPFHP